MIGVMMTYKPSPKPNFHEPTHIEYKKMETYMWGDDEAGKVKDWIYVSNEDMIYRRSYVFKPYSYSWLFKLEPNVCDFKSFFSTGNHFFFEIVIPSFNSKINE